MWNQTLTASLNGTFGWRVQQEHHSEISSEILFIVTNILSAGGVFRLLMSFPPEFPMLPPSLKFMDNFWHPNGESCYAFHDSCFTFAVLLLTRDSLS